MRDRSRRVPAITCFLVPAVAALSLLTASCGVLNPALLGEVGGNPVKALDPPQGYIAVLVINQSATQVLINVSITKKDNSVKVWALTVPAVDYFVLLQDCDVARLDFLTYSYASPTGTIDQPSNLGPLIVGDGLACGNVIALTVQGAPPVFSAPRVY